MKMPAINFVKRVLVCKDCKRFQDPKICGIPGYCPGKMELKMADDRACGEVKAK